MDTQLFIQNLNSYCMVKRFGKQIKRAEFIGGDTVVCACNLLKTICPMGKAVIFYTQKTFDAIGKKITQSLKAQNNKAVNVILDNGNLDLEEISKLFNMPEDARSVLVLDGALVGIANYFATVNLLPCIIAVRDFSFYNILATKIFVKSKNDYTPFTVDCFRYVVVDFDKLSEYSARSHEIYAKSLSLILPLIDYRVGCFVKHNTLNVFAYGVLRDAVLGAFNLIKENYGDRAQKGVYYALLGEVANMLSGSEIYNNSALFWALNLIDNGRGEPSFYLQIALKILGVYNLYITEDLSFLTDTVDYLSRSDYLKKPLGGNEKIYLKNYITQRDLVKVSSKELKIAIDKVKSEISAFYNLTDNVKNTYGVLKGSFKKSTKLNKAIKYSGDGLGAFNLMTAIRESGLTEIESFN